MRKKMKIILNAIVLIVGFAIIGCNGGTDKTNSETHEHADKVQYTCSMHPEVVEDEPGDCPKCGMALVEKKEENHENHNH